jgi:hypothetical protein
MVGVRIAIELDREEAPVLSELLFRWTKMDRRSKPIFRTMQRFRLRMPCIASLENRSPRPSAQTMTRLCGRLASVFENAVAALGRSIFLMGILAQAKEAPII